MPGLENRARGLLECHPNSGIGWKALGISLQAQGKETLPALQKTTELLPDDADAHNNLGNALRTLGRLDGALASYARALEIDPDYAEAHNNLGNALQELGQYDGAAASYRRALAINPDDVEAQSNLLFALNYHPDKRSEEIYAAYREYDERFGLPQRGKWRAHSNSRDIGRCLKVGYIGGGVSKAT